MTKTVLILGASGKIGAHSAKAFRDAGWTVRRYRRGTDMAEAARGCDVVVNGLNPPAYHDWDRQIPRLTAQVIEAARASDASVILPGNVYHFGAQGGEWSEATPARPCARKGRIRQEMEQDYAASGVQAIVLRAGNFIDPDGNDDVMRTLLLRDIRRGKERRRGTRTPCRPMLICRTGHGQRWNWPGGVRASRGSRTSPSPAMPSRSAT